VSILRIGQLHWRTSSEQRAQVELDGSWPQKTILPRWQQKQRIVDRRWYSARSVARWFDCRAFNAIDKPSVLRPPSAAPVAACRVRQANEVGVDCTNLAARQDARRGLRTLVTGVASKSNGCWHESSLETQTHGLVETHCFYTAGVSVLWLRKVACIYNWIRWSRYMYICTRADVLTPRSFGL